MLEKINLGRFSVRAKSGYFLHVTQGTVKAVDGQEAQHAVHQKVPVNHVLYMN